MYKFDITCLVVLFFIAVMFFAFKKKASRVHTWFSVLLLVSMFEVLSDTLTLYTVNHMDTVPLFVNIIVHKLYIGLLVAIFYVTYGYIRILIEQERPRSLSTIPYIWVPLVVSIIVVVLLPIEFREAGSGNYSTGPVVYFVFICSLMYLVLTIYNLVKYWKVLPSKKRIAITAALVSEGAVSLYQAAFPESLVASLGVVLLSIGFYITVESPDSVLIESLAEEKKRAELAETEARTANYAKSRFLARMSHEIRTPINAVLGMDEMIIRESREKSIRGYAADIKNAGNTLLTIINDILDFSKIESGKMEIVPVEYSVIELAKDIQTLLAPKFHTKDLKFSTRIDRRLPSKLFGDDVRIKQILVNMLSNAVKYTNAGSVTLSVDIVSIDDDGPEPTVTCHVEVSDTGIGIKEEDQAKLFQVFQRLDEDRNHAVEGSGLGLNITKQLLELMGSTLEFKSVYDTGSTFYFDITQKIVDAEPIGDLGARILEIPDSPEYNSSFIAPDARILCIDDDEMNRRVFKSLLKETMIQVSEASDGMKGIELATSEHFDIIFIDHMMPGMDGVETMKHLRSLDNFPSKDATLIIFTANAIAGAKENFLSEGFDAFLSKPVDAGKLEELIRKYLPENHVKTSTMEAEPEEADFMYEGVPTAELPIINGLDWSFARLHFANDKLMFNILDFFCSSIDGDAFELDSYFTSVEDDFNRRHYQTKVHSMKSSAATVGIIPLAGMAKVLEDAARTSDFETLRTMHPIFIRDWLAYKETLAQFIRNSKPTRPALENAETVNELIVSLHNAAEEMDIDLLDKYMSEINEYSFDGDDEYKIEDLRVAVRNFDLDFILDHTDFRISA